MGTRRNFCWVVLMCEDHPHAYGDKNITESRLRVLAGSSPRVWGQGASAIRFLNGVRIIPTRMGTSIFPMVRCRFFKDHPHAYGDKGVDSSIDDLTIGSSPRVWGQGNASIIIIAGNRIIPTRMGTSLLQCSGADLR